MNTIDTSMLVKLSEVEETVANPDEDIRGRDVTVAGGEKIGRISDLLIDQDESRVRFLEIASGGFLGIGRDITYVPIDAITAIRSDTVEVGQTREHIAGAPIYDPELVRERETYGGILSYYGYGPFWGPGYRYPDLPHGR